MISWPASNDRHSTQPKKVVKCKLLAGHITVTHNLSKQALK